MNRYRAQGVASRYHGCRSQVAAPNERNNGWPGGLPKPAFDRPATRKATRTPLRRGDWNDETNPLRSPSVLRRLVRRCVERFVALADGTLPTVRDPRATDADDRFEPQWEQALTITVGPQDADLVGKDDRVLQAAVDYVARYGGGTVEILPGTYTLRNAVHLPSRIRILGHGADSVITKIPSRTVPLAADSDWYDREITLQEAEGFRIGDGVLLRAKNPHNGGATVIKQTLTAQAGRRFKLSQGLRENLWLEGQPTCSSLFPLLTSDRTSDVVIENITLDGNSQNNENLNGNYGGCIFLQNCQRYTIRKVIGATSTATALASKPATTWWWTAASVWTMRILGSIPAQDPSARCSATTGWNGTRSDCSGAGASSLALPNTTRSVAIGTTGCRSVTTIPTT